MHRTVVIVLALTAACGGHSSTAPNAPNIAGNWSYSITNLAGGGVSCNVSTSSLTITQTDSTFIGTNAGGMINCVYMGEAFLDFLEPIVRRGVVSGNNVSFDIGVDSSLGFHNTGTISGSSINGTVTATAQPGPFVTLTGNFTAIRQ